MSTKTKKIKTLIVDDEPLARQTIRDLLVADPEIEIIGECKSGLEAVNFIRKQSPDLLFIDIQMPGMSGFEALAKIDLELIPAIVFVTAFDQYAVKAFEVHALDYLLKPFSDKRFNEALQQAKTHVELREINRLSQSLVALLGDRAGSETLSPKRKGFLTRFMVRSGGRVTFIKTSDVDWIAADDYYIKLHVSDKSHLLRISMNELEEKLDPKRFLRIHRSTIINFDRVKELHQNPNGEYVVVLKNGTELKLSRSRRERFEELLMNDFD
ncbi:MAG: two-component system, LytTR family, response regulator [Acidobacteriota bacterium]|jgi:two-component system LytT family response regulator|nr:two-component system, LytTR family, response regulator [Acidobacteriota bacterium]